LTPRELCRRLQDYLETHALGAVLPAPFEVEFAEDSAVQPDVLVILESQRQRLTAERFYGPLALVVEVVSYSSKRTDRLEKRELYLTEGVLRDACAVTWPHGKVLPMLPAEPKLRLVTG